MAQQRHIPSKSEVLQKKALSEGTEGAAKIAVETAKDELVVDSSFSIWGEDELLDPEKYMGSKPLMAQEVGGRMQFVAKYMKQFLNKYHGRNGKYTWRIAFILPEQIPEYIQLQWRRLTLTTLGPDWAESKLGEQLGLKVLDGAIYWPGMAAEEKFYLMVQTDQRREELKEYQDKRIAEMLRPPEVEKIDGVMDAEWQEPKEERKQHAHLEEFSEDPELAASSA